MPSQKATLDLDSWSNFLPKERNNDYEYNLLLYKFKTFFNEVKDFHQLHSNCSVTRANSNSNIASATSNSVVLPQSGSENNNNNNTNHKRVSALTNSYEQHVNELKKKSYSYNQESGSLGLPREPTNTAFKQNLQQYNQFSHQHNLSKQQQPNATVGALHYNSSHNISSLTNSPPERQFNPNNSTRPEIRQRAPITDSRTLLSKSSERIDAIMNNHHPVASSIDRQDLQVDNRFSSSVDKDSRYLQNDSNIYDAVSPDETEEYGAALRDNNVSSSIQNLSRQPVSSKSKLESFKSSPGLGSSFDQSKFGPKTSRDLSSIKSTPNASNNDQERSNNSFGSSVILDASNNTSSSLSMLPAYQTQDQNDASQYANYVNIDFFLKRSHSPSFDGLDDDDDDDSCDESEEETTHMSHSLSSDQICDDSLRDLSPRVLDRKIATQGNNNSSSSLTPASSGDLLDDSRSPVNINAFTSPLSKHFDANNKLSSFFSSVDRSNEDSVSETGPNVYRDANAKNICVKSKTLGLIRENKIEQDGSAHVEARTTMRSFLSDLNLSPLDDFFEDKAQRRIVKESFAVEFCGRRKLRHLFLFNDVIVCAKYQASSKQKFTFDVKWYLNLNGVSVVDPNDAGNLVKFDKEAIENQILAIRTNLMLLRGQMQHIKRSKSKKISKIIKKLKKKRTELEADLVLLLPHLPLIVKHINGKRYTFFFSSNFDRSQWIESIKFLQSQLPATKSTSTSPSSSELQAWIQTCRKNLNPSLGTFLLRSNCDDDLLYGDLQITLSSINGLTKPGQYYFCFEVDSYGHFSQKASSVVLNIENNDHSLSEEYVFPLDGAHTLRVLLYEDLGVNSKPSVLGKAHIELSRAWFLDKPVEKVITFNSNCSLTARLSHSNSELLSMRIPHTKLCPTFGMDITQVCKKEKTNVPILIQLCVNEVERRGMREVGIYRMSGTSTDIQRLKKAFEANPFVAELLLRDIDINSVTGFLKTYLREIPEGLFINKLYLKFVSAFNIPQSDNLERTKAMLELFHKIPIANQHAIIYLVEHLVKVNKYESYNKMSLTNLATVLGPNILKPPSDSSSATSSDPFTAVVIGSMSQAGILYFFLNRKFLNLPLTELDSSELSRKV